MTAVPTVAKIDLARRYYAQGDGTRAEALYREILEFEPANTDAWNLLGMYLCQSGRHEAGIAALRRALLLDGGRADVHMNLGNALSESGDITRAEECFRDALTIVPDYAEAHYNLGRVLEEQRRTDEAHECYVRALRIEPNFSEAHLNLGGLFEAAGRSRQAMQSYREAIRCKPRLTAAYRSLAAVLEAEEKLDDAIACCSRGLSIEPDDGRTLFMLGQLLERVGRVDEAAGCISRAIKRSAQQDAVMMSFTLATLMPPIAQSNEHIEVVRAQVAQRVAILNATALRFDAEQGAPLPPFYSAYHGRCNRDLHGSIAATLARLSPQITAAAPHCRLWRRPGERIKVGFISRFLHNHSIGKTTRGFFAQLDRKRFEAYALFLPPVRNDEIARFIRDNAEHAVDLADSVTGARERIAALELDVLFYQDIGMEAMSYVLAFSRLAPVQCLSFGHPDTTGIPAMDYFVSSDLYEPVGATAHYSEKLFLLCNLGTLAYYYRPQLQYPPKSRRDFGLPDGANLYICPQTLFKLHPDIDALFAGILRADQRALIVLLEGKYPQWSGLLQRRFAATLPQFRDRVIFLKSLGTADFINLLAVCDVSLDTPHFNGMNSSLEAFAVGTPVVTLPAALQRGRHTAGMYRRMDIADCIAVNADDYVSIAVRYGADQKQRAALSRRILERCGVLFEDTQVVREFERFFTESVACATATVAGLPAADDSVRLAAQAQAAATAENERGNKLAREDRYEEAEACYRRALGLAAPSAPVLANIANTLNARGRYADAATCSREAIALDAGYAAAYNALGTALRHLEQWDEAVAAFRRGLEIDPAAIFAQINLGGTLVAMRRLDEAEQCFDAALTLDPHCVDAHWNRAALNLLRGDFTSGWREYEWRGVYDLSVRLPGRNFRRPAWKGEDLAGKSILVHSEQGFGDTLQFVRYATVLAARGARVLLHCQAPLARLLDSVPGVERVVTPDASLQFDFHCPLMSLPFLCGTTLDSIPAQMPYLASDPLLVERWAQRVPACGGLKVGLVWTSDPHRHDRAATAYGKHSKSFSPELLTALACIAGVEYYCLQKDLPLGGRPTLPMADFMPEANDFADTAALIEQLDLVISIDTSVMHLAGAMGKRVWLLLPFDSDWRWLLERTDSPWYPTARLFRQTRIGDWPAVMVEVVAALRELAEEARQASGKFSINCFL